MPEYFEMSLIAEKTQNTKATIYRCLAEKFALYEGENENKHFGGRRIVMSHYEDKEADFEEICISFPDQRFYENSLETQLTPFTLLVQICFECCKEVQFALCSYEINAHLLKGIKRLAEFNNKRLSKFPLVYKRDGESKSVMLFLHLNAQNIF